MSAKPPFRSSFAFNSESTLLPSKLFNSVVDIESSACMPPRTNTESTSAFRDCPLTIRCLIFPDSS